MPFRLPLGLVLPFQLCQRLLGLFEHLGHVSPVHNLVGHVVKLLDAARERQVDPSVLPDEALEVLVLELPDELELLPLLTFLLHEHHDHRVVVLHDLEPLGQLGVVLAKVSNVVIFKESIVLNTHS